MNFLKYALVATALVASTTSVFAAGFENIVLSASEDAEETEASFGVDTAKLYLTADITDDVSSGSKITVAWIAVDSGGAAPPNFRIDEVSFDVGAIENHLDASLSKPNNGFPAGKYQVEIAVDGKVEETVDFTME